MRGEEQNAAHLWDMLEAATAIQRFLDELTMEEFLSREAELSRLAVERKLEILGEAARRITIEFQQQHQEIPWRDLIGLRNIISHQYEKVNYKEIYRIIRERMPELVTVLRSMVPTPPTITD